MPKTEMTLDRINDLLARAKKAGTKAGNATPASPNHSDNRHRGRLCLARGL